MINVFANNLRNFVTESVSIASVSISAAFAISATDLRPFFAIDAPAPAPAPALRRTSCITASS